MFYKGPFDPAENGPVAEGDTWFPGRKYKDEFGRRCRDIMMFKNGAWTRIAKATVSGEPDTMLESIDAYEEAQKEIDNRIENETQTLDEEIEEFFKNN